MDDKKNKDGCAAGCLGGCLGAFLLIMILFIGVLFFPIIGIAAFAGGGSQNDESSVSSANGFISPFRGGFIKTSPDYPWGAPQIFGHHTGEDLGPASGDNTIVAMHSGTVISVIDGYSNGPFPFSGVQNSTLQKFGGNQVVIEFEHEHWPNKKVYLNYCHMQSGSIKVKEGSTVQQGDEIGILGNSGNAFGPHLHLILAEGENFSSATDIDPDIILDNIGKELPKETASTTNNTIVLISTRKGELYE